MKQTHETRLQRLEQQAQPQPDGFALWVGTDDDEMLSPDGEIISAEEFARRYPDAIALSVDAGEQCEGP